jgi:hypothetical protein
MCFYFMRRNNVTGKHCWGVGMSAQQNVFFFLLWRCDPTRVMASFLRFLDHTQRRTIIGRTPLDEWSACRRDLYLTTHNRQTSTLPDGFEPTISAGERPQTYASDHAATGTGTAECLLLFNCDIGWYLKSSERYTFQKRAFGNCCPLAVR